MDSNKNLHPRKDHQYATWTCAVMPALSFLVFLTMALCVRVHYGYWPEHAIKLFETIPLCFLMPAWFVIALLAGVAAPLWVVLLLFPKLRLDFGTHAAQLAVYVGGWVLYSILLMQPGLITWFLD